EDCSLSTLHPEWHPGSRPKSHRARSTLQSSGVRDTRLCPSAHTAPGPPRLQPLPQLPLSHPNRPVPRGSCLVGAPQYLPWEGEAQVLAGYRGLCPSSRAQGRGAALLFPHPPKSGLPCLP
uniref:Uncharacterized protein n=1 Tax=Malurus cyaneus samueli TaxID=2593467 RepID=A0A8C5UFX8_9PASS